MRIKLDENEKAFINERIAYFEKLEQGCDDAGCWCHTDGPPREACEMYHNDLRIKFEFDPMGLTNKQKGIMALTTQPTF